MPLASILARPQFTATERDAELELPDGRRLSYAMFGAPAGPLVVVLDGPGSRGLARAAAAAAEQLGLRLVAPDRPGFAGSTQVDGDRIAAWPARSRRPARRARRPPRGHRRPVRRDAVRARRRGAARRADDRRSRSSRRWARSTSARCAPRAARRCAAGRCSAAARRGCCASRWRARVARRPRIRRRRRRRSPPTCRRATRRSCATPRTGRSTSARRPRSSRGPTRSPARSPAWRSPGTSTSAAIDVPVALWSGDRDDVHPTSHARRIAELLPGDAPVHVVAGAGTFGLMAHYGEALRFAAQLG